MVVVVVVLVVLLLAFLIFGGGSGKRRGKPLAQMTVPELEAERQELIAANQQAEKDFIRRRQELDGMIETETTERRAAMRAKVDAEIEEYRKDQLENVRKAVELELTRRRKAMEEELRAEVERRRAVLEQRALMERDVDDVIKRYRERRMAIVRDGGEPPEVQKEIEQELNQVVDDYRNKRLALTLEDADRKFQAKWQELNTVLRDEAETQKAALARQLEADLSEERDAKLAESDDEVFSAKEAALSTIETWTENQKTRLQERFDTGYDRMVDDLRDRLRDKIGAEFRQLRESGLPEEAKGDDEELEAAIDEILAEALSDL